MGVNGVNCFSGCLDVVAEFPNAGLYGGLFCEFPLDKLELSLDGREDRVGEHLVFRNVFELQEGRTGSLERCLLCLKCRKGISFLPFCVIFFFFRA